MSVLPRDIGNKILFVRAHIAPFTTNAVAIGTTAGAVTNLDTLAQAAADALAAQTAKREAAKAATSDLRVALAAMTVAFGDIVQQVHVKASTSGDVVYGLAQLPIPATPSSKAPPGTPEALKVALEGNGGLTLTWKCNNPAGTSGTIYQIWRALGGSDDFKYVGGIGTKKFTDVTVPAGATRLTYQIQASRSTKSGGWATFDVRFGTTGGTMTAMVTESPNTPKIAA
jgi:hypothetical protein